jgi:hypothetical protein
MSGFSDLAMRLDPEGTFRNAFIRRFVFGDQSPEAGGDA